MKTIKKTLLLILIPGILVLLTAGHHFETDLAQKYPQLDLTDLFVFKSNLSNKTVFLLDANPQSKKDSFNFAEDGIYKFHIAEDKAFSKGQMFSFTFRNNQVQLFSFTFRNNQVQLFWDDKPENELSETGLFIAEGPINRILELDNGIRICTGTTWDNFQGNAQGVDDFKQKITKNRNYDLSAFDIGEKGNFFGVGKTSVIVFEVPNELLPETIYYYSSTSLEEEPNHWHQVNHIANVLFPHFYLDDNNEIRTKYGSQGATVDEEVKENVINNLVNYTTVAGIQKDPKAYVATLLGRIYPDIIEYKVGTEASYALDAFNGRPLHEDAMNVALALLVGSEKPIDDKVYIKPERYQPDFPFTVPIDDDYVNAVEKTVAVAVENQIGAMDEKVGSAGSETENSANSGPMTWVYLLLGIALLIVVYKLIKRKQHQQKFF